MEPKAGTILSSFPFIHDSNILAFVYFNHTFKVKKGQMKFTLSAKKEPDDVHPSSL
jgi:hypothetical protein